LIAVLTMAVSVFCSLSARVDASPLTTEQVLSQLATKYPSEAAGIEKWVKLKKNLDGGNNSAVISQLVQGAAKVAGRNDIAGIVANYANDGDIGKTVEAAARQEVMQRIGDKTKKYEQTIELMSKLFNKGNSLTPQAVVNNNSLTKAPQNWSKVLDLTATAYGPGTKDNGKWDNLTYVGTTVRKGVVAVDPKVIPMGTKLWIEGYGEAIAEDQGSAIKGNRVDLAFNSRQEALDYGIKNVKAYVLK